MKRLFIASFVALFTLGISAQENMEAFSHLSVGVEAGLHGFGIEAAMPVHKSLVLKAGVNFMPSGDLLSTDLSLDTEALKEAQEELEAEAGKHFNHKFGDEAIINAGMGLGLTNLKLMLNWYPFEKSSLYLAGGFYYSLNDDPFIKVSGQTTENDWAAFQELQAADPNGGHEFGMEIGGKTYSVIEKDGCGYMQADLRMDPLKYYLGLGLGRSVPNKRVGLQFELGAMIYSNATFNCQDEEVSREGLSEQFGESVGQVFDFMDKYPIYPQLTLRLNFLAF
jgi:hypothetical protein